MTVTEHLWIPMPDGVRLAARLWLPDHADLDPVPALLEYIPYRKADMVRARDERNHPYFAVHGYACLRVDMRGSGDSEGIMEDMYSDHELADARAVIDWIAGQPWCSGKVGMFGTSWGGTAALQANVDAPEALKAVIAVCATHDRYEDDIHHMGGCLLTDTLEWGATLPAILAAPPTPNVGPQWRRMWQARLDHAGFPVETWVREEARGDYWRRGSVIHDPARLSRPILAIGGWSDRYSNSVMSLVSARPDLTWGVVGPWGHHYPDHGHPGPAIGFQKLALEWWDCWLKGESKPPAWPRLRVWLREFDTPEDAVDLRRGRWIETAPPADCANLRTWSIGSEDLALSSASNLARRVPGDLHIGGVAGDTGYFGRSGGLPLDQSTDDDRSLCFDTPPVDTDLVLYGAPKIALDLRVQGRGGQVIVRLNDVAPDGAVALVTRTVRNLALDEALDAPRKEGQPDRARFEIGFPTTAYLIKKGHRLRVSMSSSYWPMIWPARPGHEPQLLSGRVDLPIYQGVPADLARPLPNAIDLPADKSFEAVVSPKLERTRRTKSDGTRLDGWRQGYTEQYFRDIRTAYGFETCAQHTIRPSDPLTARSGFAHRAVYRRPDGTAEIESSLSASADEREYVLEGELTAQWDGEEIAGRSWKARIPRRFG